MVADLLNARLRGAWTVRALGASAFCETWRADSASGALFVKSTPLARADMLQSEADGLASLNATRSIRVPALIGCWTEGDSAVLAMEWLDFAGHEPPGRSEGEYRSAQARRIPEPRDFGARFGHDLAALHNAPAP